MTDLNQKYEFWENCEKKFKIYLDFGGVQVPLNRFSERFPTFPNFWRLDLDRTSQGL